MNETKFLLDTNSNIQKVYIDTSQTVTVPGDFDKHTFTFDHDLGYIPAVGVWYEAEPGRWYSLANVRLGDDASSTYVGTIGLFELTNQDVLVTLVNYTGATETINMHVRVYLDD